MSKDKLSSPGYGTPEVGLIYYRRGALQGTNEAYYHSMLHMLAKGCAPYLVQQVKQSDEAWTRFVGGGVPFAVPHPVDADFSLLDDETVRLEVAAGGCG
eukprot:5289528-Pleurochrysis_carterae.AAC.1